MLFRSRQHLLGHGDLVLARHRVRHGAELRLRERDAETGEVLRRGQLLAHRARAADDDDALVERYGVRIPVLKEVSKDVELGWPFDADVVQLTFIR